MFLRLTALGEGTEDTRRRVPMGELLNGPDGHAVTVVLERLSAARLLTVDHDEVQVAHEAIIRHWPRLRGWLTDDRESLRAHRRLTEAAVDWDQHAQDDGLLYRGARLAAWDHHDEERLNTLERTFLSVSRRRQASEHAARRHRIRLTVTGLAAALATVSVLAATALVQAVQATDERDLARTQQLVAAARDRLPTDPVEAIRLARRAYDVKPTTQAADMLRQATLEAGLSGTIGPPGSPVVGAAFSPDGRRLAVQQDLSLYLYDLTRDGTAAYRVLRSDGGQRPPVFHPSGRYLAAVDGFGTISTWDLTRPADVPPDRFGGTYDKAWSIAFDPKGRWLAGGDSDGTVRLWDWATHGRDSTVLGAFPGGRALSVAVGPDGRHVAAGGSDGTVRIWDRTRPGHAPVVLRGHEGSVESVAFSPDGRRIAGGGDDGTIRIWPAAAGGPAHVLRGHVDAVESVAFSPDGGRIASGGHDGTVQLWAAGAADPAADPAAAPLVLGTALGEITSVAFAPDGRRLVGAGAGGITHVWDVTGSGDPVVLSGHAGPVWDATASPDGRKIASAGEDGTVRVWNSDGTGAPIVLDAHAGRMFGVAFSPGGNRVAGAAEDGSIHIWNATGAGGPTTLRGGRPGVQAVAFTRDGRQVAGLNYFGLNRWNATRDSSGPVVTQSLRHVPPYPTAPAAPLASWRDRIAGGTMRLFVSDPGMWRDHRGLQFLSAMSADGQEVAPRVQDVRDVALSSPTQTPRMVVLQGHQGRVRSVAVSPDGRLVATTAADDTVRIWHSTGAGEPLVFRGHGLSAENVNFTPDGRLITTYDDGTIRIWRCDVCGPIGDVLRLAGQHLHNDQYPV